MEQEDQYNTNVGQSGIKLSGGQRQRICLARALAQNKPIMIFDEAMSALDGVTEKEIWLNIRQMIMEKIVIVVTHRIQTIPFADKIYLIRKGEIVNEGKHSELMNDAYYEALLVSGEED
ncbi:MAG: ATP-binding cassette domain-containing protein [Acetatifactor sp.]|nr:ATP-binding cassette domain-containing protein [Acetatifactor sp.]